MKIFFFKKIKKFLLIWDEQKINCWNFAFTIAKTLGKHNVFCQNLPKSA